MMIKPYVTVLAIDPGGTSGMALRIAATGDLVTFTCQTPEQVFDFIQGNKDSLEQIVIENFSAETISKWGLHTVRIVGGVYALAYTYQIEHKVHQPQDRYSFQKDAKEILRLRRGVVIHEHDAASHLLRWEYDNGIGLAV